MRILGLLELCGDSSKFLGILGDFGGFWGFLRILRILGDSWDFSNYPGIPKFLGDSKRFLGFLRILQKIKAKKKRGFLRILGVSRGF